MKKITYAFFVCCMLCTSILAQDWHLTGNAATVPGTNFLGTTDAKPLMFKVNKLRSGYIDYEGTKANTSFGLQALKSPAGINNTALGYKASYSNATGSNNTAMGSRALYHTISGSRNVAVGDSALFTQVETSENVAIGHKALFSNTGINNTAVGFKALYNNVNGSYNIASGWSALYSNVGGQYNTATGWRALFNNVSGSHNTATGYDALFGNIDGTFNTAVGTGAMEKNTSGWNNVAMGTLALSANTSGNFNTAIGDVTLNSNVTGSSNSALGYSADVSTSNLSNATAIGYAATVDASNKIRIGNTNVTKIGGQVSWTTFSDGRYKQNIRQDVHGLDFINSLKPITYTIDIERLNAYYLHGKKQAQVIKNERIIQEEAKGVKEASNLVYNGFIAQEVEEAARKLDYEFSGVDKPQIKDGLYGLRYSDFVVPLVKAVQELSKINNDKDAVINELKAQNQNLENRLTKLETMMHVSNSSSQQRVNLASAALLQNTPNPASRNTTIGYSIPQQYASTKIVITDKQGRTLKEVNLSSAKGSVKVDVSVLAAGTYQYTLYADNKQIESKVMIVTR